MPSSATVLPQARQHQLKLHYGAQFKSVITTKTHYYLNVMSTENTYLNLVDHASWQCSSIRSIYLGLQLLYVTPISDKTNCILIYVRNKASLKLMQYLHRRVSLSCLHLLTELLFANPSTFLSVLQPKNRTISNLCLNDYM